MDNLKNLRIAVMGAGVMGSTIAQVFATAGFHTTMIDQSEVLLEQAYSRVETQLAFLVKEGLMPEENIPVVSRHLHSAVTANLADIGRNFDIVVEAVFESPEAKQNVYAQLSEVTRPDCILCSNTSGLDVFSITEVSHPERFMVTHWFNPPHLMKLVEVVMSDKTSAELAELICKVHHIAGQKPVLIKRYVPGFIVNRIQAAIMREASWMILNDICSAEDIDNAIKYTHGIRYCFEGPIGLWDFAGWSVPVATSVDINPSLCNDTEPNELGVKLLSEGYGGIINGKGIFGDYADPDAFREKRSRRIVQMSKVVEAFDAEDK
ncbi:MAG: 3-hydroxyacyl-CoA dehydrogenase family protein [Oscillospiraceae bacterium]|nr:3-hydroxyacyl-CoA dehydrogenase family protein [Oscillospiraceae bacterium]